jgi:WD40 repeat protein
LWDTDASQLLHSFAGHTAPVLIVAVSADGKRALSGGRDRTIRVWDLEGRRLLLALEGHTDAVTGLSFSPDGRHFVSGSLDKTVRLWGLPPVPSGPR